MLFATLTLQFCRRIRRGVWRRLAILPHCRMMQFAASNFDRTVAWRLELMIRALLVLRVLMLLHRHPLLVLLPPRLAWLWRLLLHRLQVGRVHLIVHGRDVRLVRINTLRCKLRRGHWAPIERTLCCWMRGRRLRTALVRR